MFAVFATASIACTAWAQAPPVTISVEADGKRKINLSGRQRMLSQVMAKAACFASIAIDETAQLQELKLSQHLFETTLVDLRDGSKIQKLLPETDLAINAALDTMEENWYPFGQAITKRDFATVSSQNTAILTKSNDLVTLFQKKYGTPKVAASAATLNIAGRQRMLTQKASKEFCLIAAGKDETENRTALKASVALFEATMLSLKTGDAKLGLKTPDAKILEQIAHADEVWKPMSKIFTQLADGSKPSHDQLAAISRQSVPVMEAVNAIVESYENMTD
jgi:hypothetical protein